MTDLNDDDPPPWLIERWRDFGQRHIERCPPTEHHPPITAPEPPR